MHIAVVGAGVAGRMLTWRLTKLGYKLSLFDKDSRDSEASCSFAAAGILSPLAELEMAEPTIFEQGNRSMQLYPSWLKELEKKIFFKQKGSLIAAHGADKVELDHFYGMLQRKLVSVENTVEKIDLVEKESELDQLGAGLYLPSEGQIDPIALLQALAHEIDQVGVGWYERTEVTEIKPRELVVNNQVKQFDFVFDCRGLGAKNDLPLRAVRGELLWLEAPDVKVEHLTRLLHPRYRIYIVPRPNNIYLIGATEIESEDYSPVSVRSSLELLSAAYSVHKGFGEARIIKSVVNCRPALPDNLPLVTIENGLGIINGLYRHGILLAPALVEKAIIEFQKINRPAEKKYAINA